MSVLYFIRSKAGSYIGVDTPAQNGYYPRVYEHIQSAYKIGERQNSDQFISTVGAYRCDFSILTEKDYYGLNEANFNSFSQYWITPNESIAKLLWAEFCWIYWCKDSFKLNNAEWGGRGEVRFQFNVEGFKQKLIAAKIINSKFGQALLEHLEAHPLYWFPSSFSEQNLHQLFWPEEYVIKHWIKKSLNSYLLDSEKIMSAIKDSVTSLDDTVVTTVELNLMQNLKKYLKEELDPKNYKEEIAKLSKVVNYEIDLTMDDNAINQLVNATKTMLKIKKGQLEIKVTGVKESIGTFLKTTLKQKRKDLPSWLQKPNITIKGTPIKKEMKQLTTQDAWRILAKQLQPVESALDLESLKGKLPFIADLSETEKTSLNSLLQEYKRNATEGPVQVLTQSELFQKVSENENLIPFRRREWKNGRREVVSEKTYEYIKKANPKDLKQWTVW